MELTRKRSILVKLASLRSVVFFTSRGSVIKKDRRGLRDLLSSKEKTSSITPVSLMSLASLNSERKQLRSDVMSPQLGTAALGGAIGAITGGVLSGRAGGKVSATAALGGALGALALPSLRKHLKKRRLVSVERRIGNISKRSLGV